MSLITLREQRAKIAADLKTLSTSELSSEVRTKIDAMLADSKALAEDIARLEASEQLDVEMRSTQRPPRPQPDEQIVDEDREQRHKAAFSDFIRNGERRMSAESRAFFAERRDLTTATGAAIIPQGFYPTLIDAAKLVGNTLSAVGRKVTNNQGAPMKVSLANDTGNTVVTMTGEATLVADSDPSFSSFVIGTDTVATLVKASVQELADSAFDLNSWIKTKFGVRYTRGLEQIITKGNASNVASLLTGATLGATTGATTGPVYADFVSTYAALDGAYVPGASWMMSHASRSYLMGLTDTLGRPLFIPNPSSGVLDQILGAPIVINQALDNAATAGKTGILFGDFSQGYLFRTDGDLSIERLDERFKDTLEVGFLAYGRVGGAVTDAGTHPYVSLVTHA